MFDSPLITLSRGAQEGTEAERQRRIAVHFQGMIERTDRTFVVERDAGPGKGSDAQGLRIVRSDAQRDVGVLQCCGLILGPEPAAKVSLLMAPGRMGMCDREIRVK